MRKQCLSSSATATWQSGSGTSGTAYSQGLSYDPASNVISLSTTQAAVPGQSPSGGSETQNFCYDEQNHLVWAGNSGTQPSAGTGTCGSGTLANTISGASYSTSFVYTHLGQLWQGPINSGSTQYQYLYCSSSQPHQLTGLYPLGKTCSNQSGQVYTSSYDAWGNVTNRSYNNITATLSYDALDHFTQWNAGSTNFEQTVYDASGQRVLLRSTNSTSTTMTVYAFGLQEHTYSGSGSLQSSTYYYTLAGRLLGKTDGSSTTFYLLDSLGSVLMSFNTTANSAALKGSQVYGPYGKRYDHNGTIGTSKGFTGQYNDALTGLDYYVSRYYDNVVGLFLSADKVQGDMQGRNPYSYVGGNPETYNDPTGQAIIPTCFSTCGGTEYYPPVSNPNILITVQNYPPLFGGSSGKPSGGSTGTLTVPTKPMVSSSGTSSSAVSSCGTPGNSQALCGNFGVHYALYFGPFQFGVPGDWCLDCGPFGGGSSRHDEYYGNNTFNALETDEGGVTLPEDSNNTESDDGITSIGRSLIEDLVGQGVKVIENDPDVNAWLKLNDARGSTWFNGVEGDAGPHTTTVLLGENAKDFTVYEEWLHVLEGSKRGWLGNSVQEALAEEIIVKQRLLDNAAWLGMTDKEIQDIQLWLSKQ